MNQCETCGNQYDKTMEITIGNESHTFDSFECAIQALAPRCDQCNTRILGHGTEAGGKFYCCAHCAARAGHDDIIDRV
ncbi:hypothetical protein GNX18_06900 [Microbulbifer sp. SH-1]|uniref:hypothetical protein n=1 Tax=Microbulbifer sp. SH-1 TaxID=2681547 RepID=UPI00140CE40F|nr:hypothetical protein [Microbulbifer sp. SH-1]QIL89514.1 hypothetical protein GNX18_06900 [Microbulbifer sp. SH-1]